MTDKINKERNKTISKIDTLHPELKKMCEKFLMECKKKGINVSIYSTFRTKQEQNALYLQGRAPLDFVNRERLKAGLNPITEKENKIVTLVKDSPHCYGLAFDFVPILDGKAVWNNDKLWEECGKIAEELGLEWGGRWVKFPDKPHVQIKNWKKFIVNT